MEILTSLHQIFLKWLLTLLSECQWDTEASDAIVVFVKSRFWKECGFQMVILTTKYEFRVSELGRHVAHIWNRLPKDSNFSSCTRFSLCINLLHFVFPLGGHNVWEFSITSVKPWQHCDIRHQIDQCSRKQDWTHLDEVFYCFPGFIEMDLPKIPVELNCVMDY